ncbi:hypothetical protein PAPYR_8374 [Paratrimastix pyriformis]|uniref:Uncharacterized protein n=1 Tax=Paratrimastix pyriformis TaxID=342808 RepID=A0ABQ8UFE4_9EUKA|nr:hypothetical protein PAPYR_8374 [Paratrimastix pyriformis]
MGLGAPALLADLSREPIAAGGTGATPGSANPHTEFARLATAIVNKIIGAGPGSAGYFLTSGSSRLLEFRRVGDERAHSIGPEKQARRLKRDDAGQNQALPLSELKGNHPITRPQNKVTRGMNWNQTRVPAA